jgi:hypothetical protein
VCLEDEIAIFSCTNRSFARYYERAGYQKTPAFVKLEKKTTRGAQLKTLRSSKTLDRGTGQA